MNEKKVKKTNVYYYQLFCSSENASAEYLKIFFSNIDKSIFSQCNLKKIEHSDGYVSLFNLEERHSRYILGTFVYIQTQNIPPSYNEKENKPSKLNIDDYEGLGFDSSFLYDKKTRILALESKKPGVSLKSVEDFIAANYDILDSKFKVVVLPDEYDKFLSADEYTRIEMELAIPNNDLGITKSGYESSAGIVDLMDELNATSTKIIMSNGRSRKKKLNKDAVKNLVNLFRKKGQNEPEARVLRITGSDEDTGNNHIFDIISSRLITTICIDKTRAISNFDINIKYDQLEGDFLIYKDQLEKLQK